MKHKGKPSLKLDMSKVDPPAPAPLPKPELKCAGVITGAEVTIWPENNIEASVTLPLRVIYKLFKITRR